MKDPRQRIVVDSVAFDQIFHFHRILKSITQAMQPQRLVVALFTVVALVAVGNAWDGWIDTPNISSDGLLATDDPYSDADAQDVLRGLASQSFWYKKRAGLNEGDPLPDGRIELEEVAEGIRRDYISQLREAEEGESPNTRIERIYNEYFQKMALMDSVRPRGVFEASRNFIGGTFVRVVQGVYNLSPVQIYSAFHDLFIRAPLRLWEIKKPFVVIYGLFALLMISFGGGALCRMAVCEIAGRERLRSTDGFMFAARYWIKLVVAPMVPLVMAGVLAFVLVVLGAGLFLPWLDMLGGLLYFINIVLGLGIAFFLLAYASSFLMVIPAVATECADPADAIQRSFAYLLGKPLHYLGYVVVGLIGMSLGYVVVALVVVTALNAAATATDALIANSAIAIGGGFSIFDLQQNTLEIHRTFHNEFAAAFVTGWQGLLLMLVTAYVFSYICTSSSFIYMLMRRVVDDQDFTEIWREGLVPGTLAPMPPAPATFLSPGQKHAAERTSTTDASPSDTVANEPKNDEHDTDDDNSDGETNSGEDASEQDATSQDDDQKNHSTGNDDADDSKKN